MLLERGLRRHGQLSAQARISSMPWVVINGQVRASARAAYDVEYGWCECWEALLGLGWVAGEMST